MSGIDRTEAQRVLEDDLRAVSLALTPVSREDLAMLIHETLTPDEGDITAILNRMVEQGRMTRNDDGTYTFMGVSDGR